MQDATETVEQQTSQPGQDGTADAPGPMLPGLLMAGGVLLAVVVLMRMAYRKSPAKRRAAKKTPQERLETIKQDAVTGRAPLERLMADSEELTRRLAAALDNKADRLDLLIEQADERLAELDRRLGQSPGPAGEPAPAAPRNGGRARLDRAVLDRARLDQLERERVAPNEPETASPIGGEQDLTETVYKLADEGRDPISIADQVGQPVGQVELILNLRRQTG